MATFAIGDVQGCYRTLRALLSTCGYVTGKDRIWLAGDLINRGPRSLDVMRWVVDAGDRVDSVMGNHELHALAVAAGLRGLGAGDTLDELLGAPDAEALVGWLRSRPLLARVGPWTIVHAGLRPGWDMDQAERIARSLGEKIWSGEVADLLERRPTGSVESGLSDPGEDLAVLTRVRALDLATGAPRWRWTGPPEDLGARWGPWYDHPERRWEGPVLFGHWAALGYRAWPHAISLDSGCVWGGPLTAVRLEDRAVFHQENLDGPPLRVRSPGY